MRSTIRCAASLGAISAVAIGAGALASPRPAAAADLTVTAYGGIWEEAIRECYVAEFERRTGKTAEVVLGGAPQWVTQVAANPDDPPIHIIMNSINFAHDAIDKGLVEKFTEDKVPLLGEVPEEMLEPVDGYGTIINYGAAGITYNSEQVEDPPGTWEEFVERTIAGDWVAAIPGVSYDATPTIVLWSLADVYGGDIDQAFAKVKEMKDSGNLLFWNSVTEFLNLLQSGEIDIGIYWDGRTWAFKDEGPEWVNFINPEPGSVLNPVVIQVAKNSPDLAWDYVDAALSPGPQACFAEKLQYGVVNENVEYSDKLRERVTDWQATRFPPFKEIAEKQPAWIERWNKEIGG